jgi:hypothetical protein
MHRFFCAYIVDAVGYTIHEDRYSLKQQPLTNA